MSYFMTEEQELIRNVARQFAQEEVEPLAIEMDREETLPLSLVKRAAELNFFGLGTPAEYGGTGTDFTTECIVLEEIAKATGINRYMRDARAKLVAEASTEMHLAVVAGVILGVS